jgi:integrase
LKHLPDKVHIKHGAYHYVSMVDGKRKWQKLCRISDGEATLYVEYAKILRSGQFNMSDLFHQYLGKGMTELSEGTKKGYIRYIKKYLKPVFGHLAPSDIDSGDIYEYLEFRKDQGAPVVANREIACLSSVFNYAVRRRKAKYNPCLGVKRNTERPKSRYVRNHEFLESFEAAEEYVQDLMAGIYLMGMRPGEARNLKRDQLTPNGIRWQESKTGKVKIIDWSPAVQFFVTRACTRTPESDYVFTNSLGRKWTEWGMHSALRRIRSRVDGERWTWHDLRAKAESDSLEGMGLLPLYKRMTRIKPVV